MVTPSRKPKGLLAFLSRDPVAEEEEDPVKDVIQDYAYQYFLSKGGREEEWDEDVEMSARREMLRKWRESDWGRVMTRRGKKDKDAVRASWVGDSFEIGDILGVNYLDGAPRSITTKSSTSSRLNASASTAAGPSTFTADTFVTAHSQLSGHAETSEAGSRISSSPVIMPSPMPDFTDEQALPSTSTTHLLRPSPLLDSQPKSELVFRSALKPPLKIRSQSDGILGDHTRHPLTKAKVGKSVRIQEQSESPPASPRHVLERTGSKIKDTSAAAAEAASTDLLPDVLQEPTKSGDVVMEGLRPILSKPDQNNSAIFLDRMLVRVSYTKDERLGSHFDDAQNRSAQHMDYRGWAEFLVIWRRDRVELYEDYVCLPFEHAEYNLTTATGRKYPSKRWPLDTNTSRTLYLSLIPARSFLFSHSWISLSVFCAHPLRRTVAHIHGYHFIGNRAHTFLSAKSNRGRGLWIGRGIYGWCFHEYLVSLNNSFICRRYMGGQLPPQIEVRSPILDVSLRVDVPDQSDQTGVAIFARENLIKLCMKSLSAVPDWELILQRRLEEGAKLELAWRVDTHLDWIWWADDIDGQRRDWAVLSGISLNKVNLRTFLCNSLTNGWVGRQAGTLGSSHRRARSLSSASSGRNTPRRTISHRRLCRPR